MGNKCGKKNKEINPGAVIDRVISQASNEDSCLLYRLANYKKGGELIDAYNVGGSAEVEKLIREQFGILMYKEGKGQIVTRAEYLRWKFRNTKHVVIPVVASGPNDPLAKWEDHLSCWQMQYRGSLGESLLHLLIICDTKIHTKLAKILLKCYPNLAVDIVEGEEYYGAGALHLAIAYSNNQLVKLIVECGAIIDQRATGSFFLPRDQQRVKPAKETDYEGLAYLGEYALAWAACMNNESVYNLLLDKGADPDNQDSFGNMILHMVVITDQLGMFGYALRHPHIVASSDIENNLGLTPLTLACQMGRDSVFREMLELSAKEYWRYSNITCSGYPLNALDTIMPDGKTNWNSALFMILEGSKEEHLNMLEGGIIQKLLEEKWKTFAQNQFLKRISIAVLHLICLSMATYLRPLHAERGTYPLMEPRNVKDWIRMFFEVGALLGTLSFIFIQQGGEIKNQGFFTYCRKLPTSPPKAVFLLGNFFLLAIIPFRLKDDLITEERLLAYCLVCSWFYMMFFAGAIKLTGPFVTMIYSMIAGDMLTFGIIFTIFILGFSQTFYYLYKSYNGPELDFKLFSSTWMSLFHMTMGSFSYDDLGKLAYPNLSKTVFIIFMILVPILLLNMLIAMMGNTYSQVIERSEKEFLKQWAKLVVALERAVSEEDCKSHIQEYSIKISGTTRENEVRGVMVIKSMPKTRANQRKGALSNWKKVGKVTIRALKRRKMTGEELRCIMWGHRVSISTPQKGRTPRGSQVQASGLLLPTAGDGFTSALDNLEYSGQLGNGNAPISDLFGGGSAFDENVPQVSTAPLTRKTPVSDDAPKPNGLPAVVSSPGSSLVQSTAEKPLEGGGGKTSKSILKSPSKQSKKDREKSAKKRSDLGSTRPRIIIFSDKKDLIRGALDSSDEFSDDSDLDPEKDVEAEGKSKRKELTGGETKIQFAQPPEKKGVVNLAYEPNEDEGKKTQPENIGAKKPGESTSASERPKSAAGSKGSKGDNGSRAKFATPKEKKSSQGKTIEMQGGFNGNKNSREGGGAGGEAEVVRPMTAQMDRVTKDMENICNMNELVSWERPEDEDI